MKISRLLVVAMLLVAPAACQRENEQARARAEEGLQMSQAWCRATPQGAKSASCFLTLTNNTGQDESLTGAKTNWAERAEIHETYVDGNVLRMRPIEALTIPARATVQLAPGSYVIRLRNINRPFVVGTTAPVTLDFSQAGARQILFPVRIEEEDA